MRQPKRLNSVTVAFQSLQKYSVVRGVPYGIAELKSLPTDCGYAPAIRISGGGRKPYDQTCPDIDSAFLAVVNNHTAGDPMDGSVRWPHLTHAEIAQRLNADHGFIVSETVVRQLLKKHDFVRRKAQKKNGEVGFRPQRAI